jgi:hypothetical protein
VNPICTPSHNTFGRVIWHKNCSYRVYNKNAIGARQIWLQRPSDLFVAAFFERFFRDVFRQAGSRKLRQMGQCQGAHINLGNSGGPLISLNGEVVGLNKLTNERTCQIAIAAD